MDIETLKKLCRPVARGEPLLRPFVCRGPLARGGAFMVGVNPATTIIEADAGGFDQYVASITDLDRFLRVYDRTRVREGKGGRSPTRNGLDTASAWLKARGFRTVLDTNISPYPTASVDAWRRLAPAQKAFHVFQEVITHLQPSFVLLHGSDAYKEFTTTLALHLLRRGHKFSEVISHPRLGVLTWPDGTTANVYVCKHLRFFKGHEGGKYFAPLRASLKNRPRPTA